MLRTSVRILNFDDSVIRQQRLVSLYSPEILDLRDAGKAARHWLDKKTIDYVRQRIRSSSRDSLTFLGSGDYHHISSLLISEFREPINIIVFDYHPDWDIFPPRFACGSWVSRALENSNVLKVIYLGVSSGDISDFRIQTGNLSSLKSDRVEIYPYCHRPTKVFFRAVPQNLSFQLDKGLFFKQIRWQELKNYNLVDFLRQVIKRLPVKETYVTVDKDCLRAAHSLTNWEEGHFKLGDLLAMLRLIKDNLNIVGLDIAGDFSQPCVSGWIKNICSTLDHPKDYTAKGFSACEINSRNEQTNIKIIEALNS